MSRLIHRPNQAVDYGQVETSGSNPLGDNNDGTAKGYTEDSGSILLYPQFNPALIPGGRSIIAVRAGHRQANGGAFGLSNGWVMGFLRINSTRVNATKAYKQDGNSGSARPIEGPPLYAPGLIPWTVAQINTMSTDVGAATGTIGPNTNNRWCICTESYIILVLDDPVPIPTPSYPAAGGTVNTSSVNFTANAPASQPEQPVAAVFQVARDAAFTQDVKTFIGGLNQDTAAGSKSYYASSRTNSTYTNLGPGQWFMRLKGRDYRGVESNWGATTSFTVAHGALPTPTLTKPTPNAVSPTPYGIREATFSTDPSGDRIVGAEWQFSKDGTFATGVVSWTNRKDGRFDKGPVQYDPVPQSTVTPGLYGDKVSSDDPDQYLSQGTWFARVRAADIWGQVGAWSSSVSFTVSHPPVVADPFPGPNKAFDDDLYPVRWRFTDPWSGDNQSGYQVVVVEPNSGTVIFNSGYVGSAIPQAAVNIPDTYLQQTLNVGIAIWDRDGVKSTTTLTTAFFLSRAPIITLNYPAPDEQIITGQPTLNWSVQFARAGVTQKSFAIAFVRRDTGVVEYTTGVVVSNQTSWTAPSAVLKNMSAYQLALQITDSDDLSRTLLRNFSTNYVRPVPIASSAYSDNYENDGFVTVLWPDAQVDPLFVEYRIYRKNENVEDSDWELAGTVTDRGNFEFHDWGVGGTGRFRYTVTQVILSYGALVESIQDEFGEIVSVQSSDYWFISPGREEFNVRLFHVVGDKFTDNVEMSEHKIIHGGRRVNYGDFVGMDGTLSAQVRANTIASGQDQRMKLRRLQTELGWVMMRDPFGNYTRIALGEISTSRIAGVGVNEYVDLEIPYKEVGTNA